MKYGLFSDIHGNLEAFEAVLKALKKEKVDQYLFLGDIVGYGADPRACIDLLKDLVKANTCLCVAGNHDYAVCGLSSTEYFVQYAKESIAWTKTRLQEEEMNFLSQMKLVQHVGDITIVHASLEGPSEWRYIFDIDDAFPNFKLLKGRVCFVGHSHKPIIFTAGETVAWSTHDRMVIRPDVKYIINIGSVGQPRDGNPRASYALYDTQAQTVRIKRVAYPVEKAQEKILAAGLPKILAERLCCGK